MTTPLEHIEAHLHNVDFCLNFLFIHTCYLDLCCNLGTKNQKSAKLV